MIVKIRNILGDDAPKTFLSQPLASGGTTSYVRNINDVTDNWAVQIGEVGHEKTEVVVVDGAPASGTVNHGACSYDHPTDTPLYSIKYDQVVFKVSTDGTAGTAAAITSGTVGYSADSLFTQLDHTAGSTSYAYKAAYLSSGLTTESPNSDWLTSSGFSYFSLAKLRQRVKGKMPNSPKIQDDDIDDWLNEWYQEMRNAAVNIDEDYFLGTVDVTYSGTTELGTITDENFISVRRVWLTDDGTNWYPAEKKNINLVDSDGEYWSTMPYYYMQSDNVMGRLPSDVSGTARLVFYSLGTTLTDDTDELPHSMRGYSKSYVDYALGQSAFADNRATEGLAFEQKAGTARNDFVDKISNSDNSMPVRLETPEIW